MIKEQFSCSKPVKAYTAGALAPGANVGLVIDTKDYRSLTIALDVTVAADQIDSVSFQESADNITYVAVPEAEALYYPGSFPITADGLIHVGTVAKERYVKLVINAAAITGTVVAAYGLLQDSVIKPQVKESSVVADADMIMPSSTGDAVTTPPKRTA